MRRVGRFLVCTVVLGLAVSRPALGQGGNGSFSFTLSGGPLLFAQATAADFEAGAAIHPTGLTFLVDVANSAHPLSSFQTTVSIRATSPTFGGFGKPASDIEWSLGSPAGPWIPLGTVDVPIESRSVRRNRANDPWGNTIHFRVRLAWATDVPATYSGGLVVTLTVTGP